MNNQAERIVQIRDEFMPIIEGELIAVEVDEIGGNIKVKGLIFKAKNGEAYMLSESHFANGSQEHLSMAPYFESHYESIPVTLDLYNANSCSKCGTDNFVSVYVDRNDGEVKINCNQCGISGPFEETEHDAVVEWNKIVGGSNNE